MDLVAQRMRMLIAAHFDVLADAIDPTTNIAKELGADSLEMLELVWALEEEFNIELAIGDPFVLPDFQSLVELVRAALNRRPEPLQPL